MACFNVSANCKVQHTVHGMLQRAALTVKYSLHGMLQHTAYLAFRNGPHSILQVQL
jgi:hypothetical protein